LGRPLIAVPNLPQAKKLYNKKKHTWCGTKINYKNKFVSYAIFIKLN